ncbi:MAG: ATP-binding cassette domain-containing protein [Saprospiraceae bacterium]|nr:ATP-binding cassette domain-containing protein [Saprospiraceae bacterium]
MLTIANYSFLFNFATILNVCLLIVKNVNFSYKTGTPVLDNVSFTLEKGKTLAIVGASSCSKSTLLRIISSICPARIATDFKDSFG